MKLGMLLDKFSSFIIHIIHNMIFFLSCFFKNSYLFLFHFSLVISNQTNFVLISLNEFNTHLVISWNRSISIALNFTSKWNAMLYWSIWLGKLCINRSNSFHVKRWVCNWYWSVSLCMQSSVCFERKHFFAEIVNV